MKKFFIFIFLILLLSFFLPLSSSKSAYALMPYYALKPKDLTVRSEFYTSFYSSTEERKHNIFLASSIINKTFVDVGEVFSFNKVVGERSIKNGFKEAKIITDGKFTEGVGGGVCQVSTTLYNAVLLADLQIIEYHPHSLAVSYISPSFDAMVSYGYADLKFKNNTNNPIIIFSTASENQIKFTILGEKKKYNIYRESLIKERLEVENEYVEDTENEYNLNDGEQQIISYGKQGLKSEGFLIYKQGEKIISKKRIRKDTYKSTKNIIVKRKSL